MGISTFPAPSTGGETNDFILDKNGTTNTTFSPGRSFAGGGYSLVVTGSTAYDIYLLDSAGSSVGYTNGTSIVASAAFETISALGLGTADVVSFTYNGPSTDATTTGDETGAGAFLTSITPSDLPQIDDTAIVAGGNFASDVEVSFISGTVTKAAKNVVVGSSTALVVTRPDDLIEDLAPYDLKAINPGVTEPTGSNAGVLSGTVTAGTDPSFVTTSPILGVQPNVAISTAIVTSDSEGSVVSWEVTAGTVPTGVTLGTADGVFSGTPTVSGDFTFTVQITDDGGNTNSAAFNMPVGPVFTAPNSTAVGGTTYLWFDTSDDLVLVNAVGTVSAEYLVIAGGGGGSTKGYGNSQDAGGGGGAGGLLFGTADLTNGTTVVTIGAGGASVTDGEDTTFGSFATALGGGASLNQANANAGGSGGGGSWERQGGTALASGAQGNAGAAGIGYNIKGGGGGGAAGTGAQGGDSSGGAGGAGADYGAWATAIGIIYDGGYFAGGGGGGSRYDVGGSGGIGGGGDGISINTGIQAGSANSGGGGGGGDRVTTAEVTGRPGGSGLVVVRYS